MFSLLYQTMAFGRWLQAALYPWAFCEFNKYTSSTYEISQPSVTLRTVTLAGHSGRVMTSCRAHLYKEIYHSSLSPAKRNDRL